MPLQRARTDYQREFHSCSVVKRTSLSTFVAFYLAPSSFSIRSLPLSHCSGRCTSFSLSHFCAFSEDSDEEKQAENGAKLTLFDSKKEKRCVFNPMINLSLFSLFLSKKKKMLKYFFAALLLLLVGFSTTMIDGRAHHHHAAPAAHRFKNQFEQFSLLLFFCI